MIVDNLVWLFAAAGMLVELEQSARLPSHVFSFTEFSQYERTGETVLTREDLTIEQLAQRRLTPVEYIDRKKVAGHRELSPLTTYRKSLKEYFGKRKIRTIQNKDIETFNLHLIRKPTRTDKQRSVAAVHRELEFLRALLNFAQANGWLERSPFQAASGKKLINKSIEKQRERFPTFGEELAMNVVREIPMTARVKEQFTKLCEGLGIEDMVFGGLMEFKKAFQTLKQNIGIEDLHFHDFRYAFVSRGILAGIPQAVILKASGHSSEEWKRYLNVSPDQLRRLLEPIGEQTVEEVKEYARTVMRGLREAMRRELSFCAVKFWSTK